MAEGPLRALGGGSRLSEANFCSLSESVVNKHPCPTRSFLQSLGCPPRSNREHLWRHTLCATVYVPHALYSWVWVVQFAVGLAYVM